MSRTYARRLLAVWLAFVLALTLYPLGWIELRDTARAWHWGFGHPLDHLLNLLLFVPFGWAARPAGWPWLIWLAAPLSFGIETTQGFLLERHPTFHDLILNTAGAFLGAAFPVRKPAPRVAVVLFLVGTIVAALLGHFDRAVGQFGWTFTFGTALVGALTASRFLRWWQAACLAGGLSLGVAALQPWPVGPTTIVTIVVGSILGSWPALRSA